MMTMRQLRGAMRLLAFLLLQASLALPARAGEAVRVENASRATRCAEEDNVYVKFIGAGVAHFTIEARPPAYLAQLKADSMAADFADCEPGHDRSFAFAPRTVTLYEDRDYLLVGHAFASFWRPEIVDFQVGRIVTRGLHLVQLFRKIGGRPIEILVVYPSDGYWRAKPLPPPQFADTGYGSSFLVGPVLEDGRPMVPIRSIAFDPATRAFHLRFAQGEGSVRVAAATSVATRLDIALTPPPGRGVFAALRSMFVSPAKADTAEAVFAPAGGTEEIRPILDFAGAETRRIVFARSAPSRHNASAPDLVFGDFAR